MALALAFTAAVSLTGCGPTAGLDELNLEETSKHTSLKNEMILEAYNGLINKKIIKINTVNKNNIINEIISLDDFYESMDEKLKKEKTYKSIDDILIFFEKNSDDKIGDIEREVINTWLINGTNPNIIIEAIKEAKYNGLCNIRYIDKVLNEWLKKGIKNKDDLEEYIKQNESTDNKDLFDYNWLEEE